VPKKAYFVKFFIIIFFVAKIQHNLIKFINFYISLNFKG
jgi:hypothetical protein